MLFAKSKFCQQNVFFDDYNDKAIKTNSSDVISFAITKIVAEIVCHFDNNFLSLNLKSVLWFIVGSSRSL